MEVTVREAAALTGRSARTLRAQLTSGKLKGVQREGVWYVDRADLPLTEAQRRQLHARADRIRDTVDDALPSRVAATSEHRGRSVLDLRVFRRALAVHAAMLPTVPTHAERVAEALRALAEGAHQYDRGLKLAAFNKARSCLSQVVADVLIAAGESPEEPARGWLEAIEVEILPAVAGLARQVDHGPGERGRYDRERNERRAHYREWDDSARHER